MSGIQKRLSKYRLSRKRMVWVGVMGWYALGWGGYGFDMGLIWGWCGRGYEENGGGGRQEEEEEEEGEVEED